MKQLLFLVLAFALPESFHAQVNPDSSVVYIHPKSQSFKAVASKAILRIKGKHSLAKSFKRNDFDTTGASIPKSFFEEFIIDTNMIDARWVYTISPKTMTAERYILYVHGGAYVRNMVKQHWALIGELVRKTGYSIVMPDYPLAPANTVETTFPMIEHVYKKLLTKTKSSNIVLMGDSAGGGFLLSLAQQLKKDKIAQPQQIILLSPWLDVTMTNPEVIKLESLDPMLDVEGSQMAGAAYAGKLDTKNPLVSPIYGNLDGLAKISLFTGGKEMLVADARKFKAMMEAEGIAMNYYEYPKLFHVWIAATFLKESQLAIDQVVDLLK